MAARTKRRASLRTPAAIALLRDDHRRIGKLLERFAAIAGDPQARLALAGALCDELTVHADLEEMELYPVARAALPDTDLLDRAEVEHDVARSLVEQVRGTGAEHGLFDARVAVLGAYVLHHIREEERELFPRMLRAGVDLDEMAARMVERRRHLRLSLGLPAAGASQPRAVVSVLPTAIIANAWRPGGRAGHGARA